MRKLILVATIVLMGLCLASPVRADQDQAVLTGGNGRVDVKVKTADVVRIVTVVPGSPGKPGKPDVPCRVTYPDNSTAPAEPDGSRWSPGIRSCDDGLVLAGVFCFENCPINPLTGLVIIRRPSADDARALLPKVLPVPRLSPPLEKVKNSNLGGYLIGMPTYFGVDPYNWNVPLDVTATEGPYSMQVIATPIRLEVKVDGKLVQTCTGSDPVDYVGSDWRTTKNACRHVFTDRADGEANVSLQIIYANTYTPSPPGVPVPVGELFASQTNEFAIPLTEVQPVIKSVTDD